MKKSLIKTIVDLLRAEGWFDDAHELLLYICDTDGYKASLKKAREIDNLVYFLNIHLNPNQQLVIEFLDFQGAENILNGMSSQIITNETLLLDKPINAI